MKYFLIITTLLLYSFPSLAQDIVKLKAQRIEGEGANEKLSNIIFHYEIENNQKLFFIKNGKRQKGHFDLKLYNYEEKPNGMLVISYNILNEEVIYDKLTIFDIRKLSVEQRKKSFDVEYPMLILMEDNQDKNKTLPMAGELVAGKFKNTMLASLPDLPTKDNSNIVKLESVDKDPLYEIKIEDNSKFTIKVEEREILSLKIKAFGEEYNDGIQVFNFMVLDNPAYKIVGFFDMTDFSQQKRVAAMGVTCPVLITIGGGTAEAITLAAKFVAGRFPKVKDEAMIHQELSNLFESMENNFHEQKRADWKVKRSDEVREALTFNSFELKTYTSEMKLGYLEEQVVHELKGESHYNASLHSYQESQIMQIIQALKSYPSSGTYTISRLGESDSDWNFVVKKANKTKGFIRFYKKNKDRWSFELFKAIDGNQMKAMLQTAAKQIGNNDAFFQGKKTHEDIFEAKKSLYGSFAIYIHHGKGGKEWQNIFFYYSFEALKYQVKNMDFNLEGWSREKEESPEMYIIKFSKGDSIVGIFVAKKGDSSTPVVGVTYIP